MTFGIEARAASTADADERAADERDADQAVPEGAVVAARAAEAKLGKDPVVLAMGAILAVTEAFVVCSGRNARQVKTIVDEVELQVRHSTGRSPLRTEGLRDLQWVLMDYGDFLVHVFLDETRSYYDLEHLWGNAPRVPWCVNEQPGAAHRPAVEADSAGR